MAKVKPPIAQLYDLQVSLQDRFDRWQDLHENGGSDPFYSDGFNLNLVRNHIISYKRQLEQLCSENGYSLPTIYNTETPIEIDNNYCAKSSEIIYNGQLLLNKVRADFDLSELDPKGKAYNAVKVFENNFNDKNLAEIRRWDYNYFKQLIEVEIETPPIVNQQLSFNIPQKINQSGYDRKQHINSVTKEKLFAKYERYLNTIPTQWHEFLGCAANVYKHKFSNQVMIYGQNKNATMVASEDVWLKAGRQLKFNQTAISSIAQKQNIVVEKGLYDISQTLGDEIPPVMTFELMGAEQENLRENFNSKYKLSAKSTLGAVAKVAEQMITLTVNPDILKKHSKLIHSSSVYIIAQKLGLQVNVDFNTTAIPTDVKPLVSIGEAIQGTTRKMLDNIEQELNLIRSVNNEREDNIGRNGIYSSGREQISASDKRINIPTGSIRDGNTNFESDIGNSTGSGQLPLGQIRTDDQEVHGGKSREQTLGADHERNIDGVTSQARGRNKRDEADSNGEHGETTPTPSDRGRIGGSTALDMDTIPSRGIADRGNISASLTDEPLALTFSPQIRFQNNIDAITLLKQLEEDNRLASTEETLLLKKYVGWGGLAKAFEPSDTEPDSQYTRLKELLTEDEYSKARESTLTAYYTEPKIIKAMYGGLLNLGIKGDINLLEPSIGTGNFFAELPVEMQTAKLHGVELDDLTGRIAKKLYPKASIQIKGYQEATFLDTPFDVIIGNVPFGEFKISNEKHSLLIHDFFFAKALDDLKPNGILAFITSKGTLDKANPSFRKYLAKRAELIGAVRLPDNAFKANAGTEITSDIIFLRKREQEIENEPNWVYTAFADGKIPINQYYLDNPQNLMGKMVMESSRFGQSSALKPFKDVDLHEALSIAINEFTSGKAVEIKNEIPVEIKNIMPADSSVKNFTYTIVEGNLYYRTNDTMELYDGKQGERIKALHAIRDKVRDVIFIQSRSYTDNELTIAHNSLNYSYDKFVDKYGYINDRVNKKAFSDDADCPLLLSIEDVKSDGVIVKAKIFTEATIKPKMVFIPHSYEDLITLSMSQLGKIDIEYMAAEFSSTEDEVISNLQGKIYMNPITKRYEPADLYLSGNVKEKLDIARSFAATDPKLYSENVTALEQVQPEPLTADQISFKLSSNFIDIKYYKQFMYEMSGIPSYLQELDGIQTSSRIVLTYNTFTSEYTIYNKSAYSSVKTDSTYGTDRKNIFEIIEDSLNLKDVKVYDHKIVDDKDKLILNGKETQLARQKQELIRHEFKDWLLEDPIRANDVIKTYNDRFNVYRTREFNGSNLFFDGMSKYIELRPHQKDAVARCLYGGSNVLLGHVVGAGKTYTMAAACMELKRIGIANKSLFVVPNHLTEQWGSDFLKLYPNANILVATKKDFEPLNRKRFISRICTGEYDAVIIGHSQFGHIPMSPEYVKEEMKNQLDEIDAGLSALTAETGSKRYSIKQMELQRKKVKERLDSLESGKKDEVITFEETGVDYIFVDEAHNYKNCFVHTKMSNVAGVSTTNAQKSFDMLLKTKYISNKNDGQGVIFATGTPISNSMTELFVMQRYLQPDALKKAHVPYFDEWASDFGETQTALELKPEGTGYRLRTRFAKFHNLPELINMFAQVADIKVADDLNLPTPTMVTGKPIIEVSLASDFVRQYIDKLASRAEDIRDGNVQPWEDNMLKVTSEGKAVAIDARLIDPQAEVDRDSKVYKCCDNVFELYQKHDSDKALQLVFLDTGLPLYQIIKGDLVDKGIPPDEVAFIHDSKTDEQKARLFARCRSGDVRVLIGSTMKMGAGTNVQERLVANHHLDCPWRPADIEQRDGRILRQGNMFDEVYIYRYITKNTFDAYLWGIQENKQKFITQIMTNKSVVRSCDDIDSAVLDCAEVKTLATGDPRIKEKMQLDNEVYLLQIQKSAYQKSRISLQNLVLSTPAQMDATSRRIDGIKSDIEMLNSSKSNVFTITVDGVLYDDRAKAGEQLNKLINSPPGTTIGQYCGFQLVVAKSNLFETTQLLIQGHVDNRIELGISDIGNITRIENGCVNLEDMLVTAKQSLVKLTKNMADAQSELAKPFPAEQELREKLSKQADLNAQMELEQHTSVIMDEAVVEVGKPMERGITTKSNSDDNEMEL